MISPTDIIQRCHDLAMVEPGTDQDADSLIGFFQAFRPDGRAVEELFDGLPQAADLNARLEKLYTVAGDDRRPQGGRYAYFVVRRAPVLTPDSAQRLGEAWLNGLVAIAQSVQQVEVMDALKTMPTIRVLEGLPPKHPKQEAEQSRLMQAVTKKTAEMIPVPSESLGAALRQAYYFVACDAMLRDYLMWPLYEGCIPDSILSSDPLQPYFELWRHGVKYRIFGENQVDLYLPRRAPVDTPTIL